jgi:hypothetical protein
MVRAYRQIHTLKRKINTAYKGKEVNMNNERKFEQLAHEFAEAIRMFAENPDNIDDFESYLSYHFDVWMEKYASYPEGLVSEFKHFAEMEI